MECTITLSPDRKYIIQKVSGEINRAKAMQFNQETHALGKEKSINKFLVDMTQARNTDTAVNNYQFAYKDMKKMPKDVRNARIATLVSPDDHSHDFIETVSQNSGLNVKIFRDRDEAIRYLLKDQQE